MIYLICRFGRNDKLAYSTGLKASPCHWNKDKMRVRNIVEAIGKDAINARLNELQAVTETHIIELKAKGKAVSKEALRKFLDLYTHNQLSDTENTLHGFVEGLFSTQRQPHKSKYWQTDFLQSEAGTRTYLRTIAGVWKGQK